jgi:hypothetical protein
VPEVKFFTNRVEIGDPLEHSVYGKFQAVSRILGAVNERELQRELDLL